MSRSVSQLESPNSSTLHVGRLESNVIMMILQHAGWPCAVLSGPDVFLLLQGHALFVRQAGGYLPCPQVDFTGGFNAFLGAAYGLGDSTIEEVYGSPFGKSAIVCSTISTLLSSCCTRLKPVVIIEDRHLGLRDLHLVVAHAFVSVQPGKWSSALLLPLKLHSF